MSKKIICAMTLAGLAGSVLAMPTPLGAIDTSGGSLFAPLPDSGPFSDQYSFTLSGGNGVRIGFTSFFWGKSSANFPSLSFSLLGLGTVLATPSVIDSSLTADVFFSGLNAGQTYTLLVSGDESYNIGPDYLLQYVAGKIGERTPYNVSEPDSFAMLLGALGLMSLLARRRQVMKGEPK